MLPGVGSFADASQHMVESGQMGAVRDAIAAGKPFLGICLGEHLLFEAGVEGAAGPGVDGAAEDLPICPSGWAWFPARWLACLPRTLGACCTKYLMWVGTPLNSLTECPLFEGIASGEYFYFTHSYIAPENECTVATTTHSVTFPCAVQKGKVFGVQFHPEKSSDAGAKVLANFLKVVEACK